MKAKTIDRIRSFFERAEWIWAVTYAKTAPHWYCLRRQFSPEDRATFDWVCDIIRQYGDIIKWRQTWRPYLVLDGYRYWVMNAEGRCDLINRAIEAERPNTELPEDVL